MTPEVWVEKYLDMSDKFGLGYVLSSGVVGALFNDSTKILLQPDGFNVVYIDRKKSKEEQENIRTFLISESPEDLKKKVKVLKHFIKHFGVKV